MIAAQTGGATTRFLYDGANLIGEYNASNALLRRYVQGLGLDAPLVRYDGTGTTNRRWLITDERGSVVAETNASGAAVQINTYDEYGMPGSGNTSRFGYTGQMWIAEIGLYHYRNRVYNPAIGRFMQTDPIGQRGGINLYAYVGNDPINYTDPWGLEGENIQRPDCRLPDCITVTGNRFGLDARLLISRDVLAFLALQMMHAASGTVGGQERDVCHAHLERAPYATPAPIADARMPPIDISRNAHPVEHAMGLQAARHITNKFNTNPEYYAEAIFRWNNSTITYTPDLERAGRTHLSINPVLEFGPSAVQAGEVTLTIGHELGHQLFRFRMLEERLGINHETVENLLDMWSRCHFVD